MGAGSLIPSRHVRHTGHELPEIIREGRELGARLISLAASELGVEDGAPVLPRNGDDRIPTHDALARAVVEHFLPCGRIVEPSSGNGAFLRALPKGGDWFEYDSGMLVRRCALPERHRWAAGRPVAVPLEVKSYGRPRHP
jgi:hypothetical protein